MAATEEVRFPPSDKRTLSNTPASSEAFDAFRGCLTADEARSLEKFKKEFPELCGDWTDPFLMRFLWARKLDISRAAELLTAHLEWRKEYEIDGTLDLDLLARHMRGDFIPWTPGNYTKQGYAVSYLRANKIDHELLDEMGLKKIMQANWMIVDASLDHDMDVSRQGGVVVEDLEGASFWELMSVVQGKSSWDLRKLSEAMQNKLPYRVGGFIIVNAPWYIKLLITTMKPFLKPKMRKKIHVCSVSELHHYFTDDQLPTFYGGKFEVHTRWVDQVIARGGYGNGAYIDPSARSEALVDEYTGSSEHPVKTVAELAAEAKGKKKKK